MSCRLPHSLSRIAAAHHLKPRRFTTMAQSSPFTRAVVSSMRKLYPESLADKSFDNTGLLLEAPYQPKFQPRKSNSVLLAIDLTRAVADEALEGNHAVVVAYHPIIFRGLKSVTLADTQQQSLLRLATNGVSVYCPHTAVDVVPGGMGDWLCDIVTGKLDSPEQNAHTSEETAEREKEQGQRESTDSADSEVDVTTSEESSRQQSQSGRESTPKDSSVRPGVGYRTYSKPTYISPPSPPTFHPNTIPHTRSVITPSPHSALTEANSIHESSQNSDAPTTLTSLPSTPATSNSKDNNKDSNKPHYNSSNTGSGRLITFNTPQPLTKLITRIATAIGQPKGFPIAIPQSSTLESLSITTVGVCPGSGSGVFRHCKEQPDLLFTGEMSHHEALAVIERGGCIVELFHSNSERGYLDGVMREAVEKVVKEEWARVRKDNNERDEKEEDGEDGGEVQVVVSKVDRDPFGIVVLEETGVEGERL